MDTLIYIIKSTVILSLFFMVYEFLLKKETFFETHRWFLMSGMFIAIILPALSYTTVIPNENVAVLAGATIPSGIETGIEPGTTISYEWNIQDLWTLLLGIYWGVSIFLFSRFFWKIHLLKKSLKQPAKIYRDKGIKYVQTFSKTSPFAFLNTVVYSKDSYGESELELILKHEEAHAKNLHSIDLLTAQIMVILNWFNPLAWSYRKRIQENLEFLADREATRSIKNLRLYQLSLLKQTIPNAVQFPVNNFHQSFLKTRIMKLHQNKSKKSSLLKIGVVLPILITFFIAFQGKAEIGFEANPNFPSTLYPIKDTLVNGLKVDADFYLNSNGKNAIFSKKGEASTRQAKKAAENNLPGFLKNQLNKNGYLLINGKKFTQKELTQGKFNLWRINPKKGMEKGGIYAQKLDEATLEKTGGENLYGLYIAFSKDAKNSVQLFATKDYIQNEPAPSTANNQEKNRSSKTGIVPFNAVSQVPIYPGCENLKSNAEQKKCLSTHISKFVAKHFNTKIADSTNLSGIITLTTQFIVGTDGEVEDIRARALTKKSHPALENEAKRVVALLPKMKPGQQKDKAVKVQYTLPIRFRIDESKKHKQNEQSQQASL